MKKQILLLIAIIVSLTSYGQNAKLIAKAEAGNARSQYRLAIDYKYGWSGFSKDEVKYIHWLKKAAEGEYPEAQHEWGCVLIEGSYNVPQDVKMGLCLVEKAATSTTYDYDWKQSNVAEAQYDLGNYYIREHYGIPKDDESFLKWMKKSAYNNNLSACFSLGLYYKDKNKQEAIYWLKKHADLYFKRYGEESEYSAEVLHELGVYYNPGVKNSYASSSSNGASSSHSSSSSRGNGSSAAVAPLMTPVQVWNPCFMCGGTGLCTSCQGKGKDWYGNSYQLCVTCHGNMYCQKCGGRKGYYTTEYR